MAPVKLEASLTDGIGNSSPASVTDGPILGYSNDSHYATLEALVAEQSCKVVEVVEKMMKYAGWSSSWLGCPPLLR